MANEAVRSTQAGAPIFLQVFFGFHPKLTADFPLHSSPSDQKILHGDENMSLEQLEAMLDDTTTMQDPQPIFTALRPCESAGVARNAPENLTDASRAQQMESTSLTLLARLTMESRAVRFDLAAPTRV